VLVPDSSDCSSQCPAGYICKFAGQQIQCVPASSLSGDAGQSVDATALADSGGADAPLDGRGSTADGSGAGDASDAARAFDASDAFAGSDGSRVADGSEASAASDASDAPAQSSCNSNRECGGGGAKCIDGQCTPQSRLCSDGTQCVAAGASCVDGVCEPHCSANAPCPGGYACDFTRGVCNVDSGPCAGSGPSTCQGGSTCVEGRCVPPCSAGGGASACPGGQLCINGGCIPDEAATFDCKNDGQSGLLATACSATAICLHHGCYPGCDPDAGASACSDPATVCKQVTVTEGTYDVCGTAANLGSDCDPAIGMYCSGSVCIDGYCR
jgi:hypothetical protein